MLLDPRAIIMFGANALLLFLMQMVNSAMAAWPPYLFILGPMIVLPALYLRHQSYFLCTFLSGLGVDASMGGPFGFFTTLFLMAGALIFTFRIRFRAEHNYHPILLGHVTNIFLILSISIFWGGDLLNISSYWIQILSTIFFSHLAMLVVAPWFYSLERQLFQICRVETEPEDLPLL